MKIQAQATTAYYAPTRRKRYFTAIAAAKNEAKAMLRRKYPTEEAGTNEFGYPDGSGYHWSDDERLCRVFDRLWRSLLRRLQESA